MVCGFNASLGTETGQATNSALDPSAPIYSQLGICPVYLCVLSKGIKGWPLLETTQEFVWAMWGDKVS